MSLMHAVIHNDGGREDHYMTAVCGHCATTVTMAIIALAATGHVKWLRCPNCGEGSVTNFGQILPAAIPGPVLQGLPPHVAAAYTEARNCLSVGAFTACELLCRKVLMNVAVEKDAAQGLTFTSYLDHIESVGYINPAMKGWADLIRQHGNQATHEIAQPDQERAESTLMFTAELLRIVYEMDYLAQKFGGEP